ncbi:nucleophile aminohydrolase [Chytriomyces cf. hyalinus JEL632]|nr:nucleophile aminohydrolase [Chytriomyces cf. hyalinus JEL632]
MSIMEYNGGAIIAMKGKGCVAIAADRRFGIQALTLGTDFQKLFSATDKIYFGLAGLATDVQTLSEKFRMKVDMYHLREEREISPKTFAHMVSSTLYEKRFGGYFVFPTVAGLDANNEPYICNMDGIGCITTPNDFVVSGTAENQLYGMCESLWEPNLEPEDLFETISQALLNGVDRDAISGWGGIVHVITPEGVITRTLKGRMD